MAQYMLLLYANEVEGEELAEREADLPIWTELTKSLEEAGLLVGSGRLHRTTSATTVSAMSGETELTDGPFAITKEALAGYYLIEAHELGEALRAIRHRAVAPQAVDGPPARRDREPCAGVRRNAVPRPRGERGRVRVLDSVFGQLEVPDMADQRGEHGGPLVAERAGHRIGSRVTQGPDP